MPQERAPMAKKKNKGTAAESSLKSDVPSDAKTGVKVAPKSEGKADAPVDVAYRAGNFAAVRQLAESGDAHALELRSRVTVDPQQILIGAITLFVVAFGAFLTLH
jgi:hypothetical protein